MTIDGHPVTVAGRHHDPAGLPRPGHRHPHPVPRRDRDTRGRLPPVRVDTGARALTPSCSAKVSQGMDVETDNDKVRHSRKLVLELLGSSVDVDLAGPALPDGTIASYMAAVRGGSVAVRAAGARPRRRANATPATPATTTRRTGPWPRPSPSP